MEKNRFLIFFEKYTCVEYIKKKKFYKLQPFICQGVGARTHILNP